MIYFGKSTAPLPLGFETGLSLDYFKGDSGYSTNLGLGILTFLIMGLVAGDADGCSSLTAERQAVSMS